MVANKNCAASICKRFRRTKQYFLAMTYRITRHDGGQDDITSQEFDDYDDAYVVLEKIYGNICCSDADYEERPYYEIVELKQ